MKVKNTTQEDITIGGHPFRAGVETTIDEPVFDYILRKAGLSEEELKSILNPAPEQAVYWSEQELNQLSFKELRAEANKHDIRGRSRVDLISSLVRKKKV